MAFDLAIRSIMKTASTLTRPSEQAQPNDRNLIIIMFSHPSSHIASRGCSHGTATAQLQQRTISDAVE